MPTHPQKKYATLDHSRQNCATMGVPTAAWQVCRRCTQMACPKPVEKRQTVQSSAARLLFKAHKQDHVSPLLITFHWLPIQACIEYELSILCHSFCSEQPLFICLTFSMSTLHQDSSAPRLTQKNLRISHIKTKTFGHRSFSFAAPSVWNFLPREIRHIQSVTAFKTAPKTYLFKSYLC